MKVTPAPKNAIGIVRGNSSESMKKYIAKMIKINPIIFINSYLSMAKFSFYFETQNNTQLRMMLGINHFHSNSGIHNNISDNMV